MRNPILPVVFCLTAFFSPAQEAIPYNLKEEDQLLILPAALREVSGITVVDDHTLACVQDEEGVVFIYNLKNRKVEQEIHFAGPGDYEGIAHTGKDLFVLRSDATLFHIRNYATTKQSVDSIATGIPNKDNEGLCFDAKNNRLLIGSKSKIAKGAEFKNLRTVYAFDLNTHTLKEGPLYTYDIQTIKDFAAKNKLELPVRPAKKNPEENEIAMKFQISALYIHPESELLYVLSASDFYLFVFDRQGRLMHIEVLDPKKFNKAEGIVIMPNGDLYISNEGQSGDPKILLFKKI